MVKRLYSIGVFFLISFPLFAQGDRRQFLPDSVLTPGDVFVGVDTSCICRRGYPDGVRRVSVRLKERVYAAYNVTVRSPGEYEIDHLVPLGIGGSNDAKNLWPLSRVSRPWNKVKKDRLDRLLHRLVCSGKISLVEAQESIRRDWVVAYLKYIGNPQ